MNKIEQNFIDSHVSFVYEDICREKIWQLSAGGCWPFQAQNVGRWWNNKDAKIDVVATDEEGGNIIFGECKYWKGPVGVNVLEMLMQKAKMVEWKGPELSLIHISAGPGLQRLCRSPAFTGRGAAQRDYGRHSEDQGRRSGI